MRRSISQPLALRACQRCSRPITTSAPLSAPPARPAQPAAPTTAPTRTRSLYYNGRFHNPWPSFKEKTFTDRLSDIRRWWSEPKRDPFNPTTYPPHTVPQHYTDTDRIDVEQALPLCQPDYARLTREGGGGGGGSSIGYTWIGHATSVIQLHNLTILTDPWFSDRPSAWQRVGPRRFRPPACRIDQLPPLDVIVISHSHFDHLDYHSVRALQHRMVLQQRESGRVCRWYVPLGMKTWLRRWAGVEEELCVEMDWWEERTVSACDTRTTGVDVSEYRVTCVGAQHWTSRLAMIDNRWQLWCGFVISVPPPPPQHTTHTPHHHPHNTHSHHNTPHNKHTSHTPTQQPAAPIHVYYSGDTGYCPVFKEIGAHFSHIDLSLLPIGAYDPEWLLSGAHVHPRDSVRIHRDVNSRRSVALHWGTVVLSDECVVGPKWELERAARESGLQADEFITTQHGRTMLMRVGDGRWS